MLLSGLNLLGKSQTSSLCSEGFPKKRKSKPNKLRKPQTSPKLPHATVFLTDGDSKVRCSRCLIPISLYFSEMTLDKLSPAKGFLMVKSVPETTKRIQRSHATTRQASLVKHRAHPRPCPGICCSAALEGEGAGSWHTVLPCASPAAVGTTAWATESHHYRLLLCSLTGNWQLLECKW